jgi:hypothetical protein
LPSGKATRFTYTEREESDRTGQQWGSVYRSDCTGSEKRHRGHAVTLALAVSLALAVAVTVAVAPAVDCAVPIAVDLVVWWYLCE